jgi:beta-lactamase regulating signal transducer with metallopeptidase domain
VNTLDQCAGDALAWLWQTSLVTAVLATIVLLFQFVFARWLGPRWPYVLWLLVIARLMLPFGPESTLSVLNWYAAPKSSVIPVTPISIERVASTQGVSPQSAPAPRVSWSMLVVAAWFLGASGYLLACIVQYRRLHSWAYGQLPVVDSRVAAALQSAQELLGFKGPLPRLVESRSMAVPAVLGILRPCLLLPRVLLDTWQDEELKLAMLHELVHVRRRDNLLNWALIFIQAVHWFNPLVWLVLRRFRAEREVLCDAIVLSRLQPDQRRHYGATLIKATAEMGPLRFSPSVVPIVNHKQEIQRRIRMIARFKPTPRAVSILVTGVVLGLACVTFTGAAQKQKPKAPVPPAALPEAALEKSLKTLEGELDKIEAQIHDREVRVEHYRHELRIPSHIANSDGQQPGPDAELLRKLEGLRIDSEAELRRLQSLYEQLAALSRPELRKIIQTAAPDPLLAALFERLADTEQKLASMAESFAAGHPERQQLTRMIEKINRQVDDRMDGILAGLKARKTSLEIQAKQLASQIEEYRERDIKVWSGYRDYFNAKRELQNLYLIRDRVHLRLLEEKIDAAAPRRAKDINDFVPTIP